MSLDFSALVRRAPLGDARRNARFQTLFDAVTPVSHAGHAVPAPPDATAWAHAMAASRFFSNPALSLPALAAPCEDALGELVGEGEMAFVAHDLSLLDVSRHNAKADRVAIGDGRGLGYELYAALVLSADGVPLAPCAFEVRTADGLVTTTADAPVPFVDHYTQVERGVAHAVRVLPGRRLVHLGDREFDELGLLRFADRTGALFVVRAYQLARKVRFGGRSVSLATVCASVALDATFELDSPQGPRTVRYGETRVTLDGKSLRGAKRGARPTAGAPLDVRVVLSEVDAPDGTVARWVLLTNVDGPASAVVRAYSLRWAIERYFFLLKTGYRLEAWRQEDGISLARRLAVTQLAALRVHLLEHAAQTDPQAAQTRTQIARLGGWLARKGDALGPVVLMRGMTRLLDALNLLEQADPAELRALAATAGLTRIAKPKRRPNVRSV